MKSLNTIKIEIKNPILRTFRNNLRENLKKAYLTKFYRLIELNKLYQDKRRKRGLTLSQKKRSSYLIHEFETLNQKFDKSICCCSAGASCISYRNLVKKGEIQPSKRPIELDMVWVPHYKKWYCVKCYESFYKVKFCEICWDTDDALEEIIECSLCEKYACELCRIFCPGCHKFYCEKCFQDHLDHKKCGSFTFPDNYKIFFEEH